MNTVDWAEVQRLFDAACDLPPEQWQALLEAGTESPEVVSRTLSLLRAQSTTLDQMEQSLRSVAEDSLGAPSAQPGDEVGPWRLLRLLGSGGMGAVYLAERADALYTRQVAIKLMRSTWDPMLGENLVAESRILADLQHPGIARLYDAGVSAAGHPFLVMEHVEGQPLAAALARMTLPQRLAACRAICAAVQAAHAQGVIHCDLKPGNVLVRADGAPVLLDFGIARQQPKQFPSFPAPAADAMNAASGYCTPAYSSPERQAGRPPSVASDVYSLGVMFAQVLRQPGEAALPLDLAAVLDRATAHLPQSRYASAEALGQDLGRYLASKPVKARRPAPAHRARLFVRRRWQLCTMAACAAATSLLFVVSLHQSRQEAERNAESAARIADMLVAAFEASDPARNDAMGMSARQVLDQGAARLSDDLSADPLVMGRLQATLGRAYQNLGENAQAERLLTSSVATLAAHPGTTQANAEARVALSRQAASAGRPADARFQANAVLALPEDEMDALVRAQAWIALAVADADEARHAQARVSYTRALDLLAADGTLQARRSLPQVLLDVGVLQRDAGDAAGSARTLREAIAQQHRFTGGKGIVHQRLLRALSSTLLTQGRTTDALQLAEEALALTIEQFGADSGNAAAASAQLAGQYLDLGRYNRSEELFRTSMAISERLDGPHSSAFAAKLHAYGLMEEARGDYRAAEAAYRRAMGIRARTAGEDALPTHHARMVLARLLLRDDQLPEALDMLQTIAGTWERSLPVTADERISLALVQVEWLTRAGRVDEAQRALDAFMVANPSPTPSVALRLQMQKAWLAERLGAPETAQLWAETVQTFSRLYGPDSTATAKWRLPLAQALLKGGDSTAARAQMRRALPHLAELAPQSAFNVQLRLLQAALDEDGKPV